MDFFHQIEHYFNTYVTQENIEQILEGYQGMGAFLGILLPALEAFLPILPLIVFVVANAAAYGFFFGFLLSWTGTCLGSIAVFFLVRRLAHRRLKRFLRKSKKIRAMLAWVNRRGFAPVFFVFCIPFTPSALINVVAGLSEMNPRSFVLAVMLGKVVMIGMVTFIGTDWEVMLTHPTRLIPVAIGLLVFWIIGKLLEKRIQKTSAKKEHEHVSEK